MLVSPGYRVFQGRGLASGSNLSSSNQYVGKSPRTHSGHSTSAPGTTSRHYRSTYVPTRAAPSLTLATSALCYDAYPFCRITWTLTEEGGVGLVYGTTQELILVSNDWSHYCHQSKPRGGYLGCGIEKFAFQVSEFLILSLGFTD